MLIRWCFMSKLATPLRVIFLLDFHNHKMFYYDRFDYIIVIRSFMADLIILSIRSHYCVVGCLMVDCCHHMLVHDWFDCIINVWCINCAIMVECFMDDSITLLLEDTSLDISIVLIQGSPLHVVLAWIFIACVMRVIQFSRFEFRLHNEYYFVCKVC